MEREKNVQPLKEYENRIKRFKRRRKIIGVFIVIILLIVGISYIFMLYNRKYSNYEVVFTYDNTEENQVGYSAYQEGMIRYGKDGAIAYDGGGKLLWNGSYEMIDPIIDICGSYAVIGDRGGKAIQIFNQKGQAGTLQMDYNISKVQVATNGIVAILMTDGESNYIRLMDRDGTIYVENKTIVKDHGYPMDIALSADGQKLAVVLLSINRGKMSNNIAFYNYGEVGQNKSDRLVGDFGGFIVDDEITLIPRIVFLDNDTVCAFKDNGFILYSMPETPDVILEQTFDQKIKSILHNEKYMGVVLEGDVADSSYIKLYDLKGNKVLDKTIKMDYDKIYITGEEIVLYNDLSCMVIKVNGKVKFQYTFNSNISGIFPLKSMNRYLLVNAQEIAEIKLKE